MSLQIVHPVTIKARVTEGLKARLVAELQEAVRRLDQEIEQLDSQAKRAVLATQLSPQQQLQVRQALELERQQRQMERQELLERVKQVGNLPLGTEVVQGTVQAVATLQVGDDLDSILATEIVVEDGKVVAIRRG